MINYKLLICVVVFSYPFFKSYAGSHAFTPVDSKKTNKELKVQLKELKKTKRALESYNSKISRSNKRVSNVLKRLQEPAPQAVDTSIITPKYSTKVKIDTKPRNREQRLTAKIVFTKKEIERLKKEKSTNDSTQQKLKRTSLAFVSDQGSGSVGKEKQKLLSKLNNTVLYESKRCFDLKKTLNEQVDLKGINKILETAKANNTKYSKLITDGKKDMISQPFQLKKDVYKTIPKNKLDVNPTGGSSDPVSGSIKQFMDMRAKAHTSNEIADTTSTTLNPYRGQPFITRIKPSYNFQFLRANQSPAILDNALVFKILLTEQVTPFVGITYRLGLGTSIHDIHFSHQGIGTRMGAEYQLTPLLGAFASYEYQFNHKVDEIENNRANRCVLGVLLSYGSKGKLKTYIGYDFINLFEPSYNRTPVVFRIGIN